MTFYSNAFVVTAICPEQAASHLIENIRQFSPLGYTTEKVEMSKSGAAEQSGLRISILCSRNMYSKVMEYLNQYYVKDYGVILFYNEVYQPA